MTVLLFRINSTLTQDIALIDGFPTLKKKSRIDCCLAHLSRPIFFIQSPNPLGQFPRLLLACLKSDRLEMNGNSSFEEILCIPLRYA